MTSVDSQVDAQAARMWRRERRWGWFLLLIPLQALACLIAYMLGRLDMGTAVLAFFALWVPTLFIYFPIRGLIWRRLGPLQEQHPENVAVALSAFLQYSKKDSDFKPGFPEFEKMAPAFRAWCRDGFPELPPATVDMLVPVAGMFPTWLVIGPPADPEVYPMIYTALMRAYKTEEAAKLSKTFEGKFGHPLESLA